MDEININLSIKSTFKLLEKYDFEKKITCKKVNTDLS